MKYTNKKGRIKSVEDLAGHGQKPYQRMKHFLVLQYLLRNTDKEHFAPTEAIINFLKDNDIYAERRSIYKDIEDINIAMLMIEEGCGYEEANEKIQEDEDAKTIRYKHKSGYYFHSLIEPLDIKLIAECIYSAKFVSERDTKRLLDGISVLLSEHQRESLDREVHLVGRIRADDKTITMGIIDTINDAIKNNEKIKFKYKMYALKDGLHQEEKRNGEWYIVSPYLLVISDGNYYMIGYDEKKKVKRILNYRVDRIDKINIIHETREGLEKFNQLNLDDYLQRTFSMYKGKDVRVQLCCENQLLDTIIDKFGTTNVFYANEGEEHFSVSTHVEVSDQFFAWVSGFRKRAVITAPPSVVKDYKKFLADIQSKYE